MSFESLGLHNALVSAVTKAGFTEPTPVQAQAIPLALEGKDLIVSAQTGSGKTAAFMLPAMHKLAQAEANQGNNVGVLVLTPTRELALQVADAVKSFGANMRGLRVAVVVGGMPYGAQLRALSRRVDVLVATPGRLIDHLNAKRVKLHEVHTLVLDEADRMLDMGFIEDIESIVSKTPSHRQTLLFSATFEKSVQRLAANMMRDPVTIAVSGQKAKHENITQNLLYADNPGHKGQLLEHVLRDEARDQAIIFTATKRGADQLSDDLRDKGFKSGALHGDMNQRQRNRVLELLQRGRIDVLVATDVAARGIDVKGITHAINFDLPMQAEDYTHRIGRTGRAGRDGLAFTFALHNERHMVRRIERFMGRDIPIVEIEGLEPTERPRPSRPSRNSNSRRPHRGANGAGAGQGERSRHSRGRRGAGDGSVFEQAPTFGAVEGRGGRPAGNGRGRSNSSRPHDAKGPRHSSGSGAPRRRSGGRDGASARS